MRSQLEEARSTLEEALIKLNHNIIDSNCINKVKVLTEKVIHWNSLEDKMLQQRSKVDWMKKGDCNTAYYYATIKDKIRHKNMDIFHKEDGTILTEKNIHHDVMRVYRGSMGSKANQLKHVDIDALRKSKHINVQQRKDIVS